MNFAGAGTLIASFYALSKKSKGKHQILDARQIENPHWVDKNKVEMVLLDAKSEGLPAQLIVVKGHTPIRA